MNSKDRLAIALQEDSSIFSINSDVNTHQNDKEYKTLNTIINNSITMFDNSEETGDTHKNSEILTTNPFDQSTAMSVPPNISPIICPKESNQLENPDLSRCLS
jgi:hypothetical protein